MVPRCRRGSANAPRPRPGLEVAHIFHEHGDAYRRSHDLSRAQRSAMRAIETCRTPVLGGHLDVCNECGHERPAYNSCRNRHCPKCEALREAQWIEQRMGRLVPSHYFHVVFTLPAEFRPLALRNGKLVFSMLFKAASRTLLALGDDSRRLGGRLGVTAVLHSCHAAVKHTFVTSESYSGALGGGLGAGLSCSIRARAARLPGTYRAWLWDGGIWPGNWPLGRASLPYMLPDGTLLAEDWATLTATSSDVPPINVDEFGDPISRAPFVAWANVGSTGLFGSHVSCGGWLFNVFARGTTGAINGNFSSTGTFWSTQDCHEPARLYCFEQ